MAQHLSFFMGFGGSWYIYIYCIYSKTYMTWLIFMGFFILGIYAFFPCMAMESSNSNNHLKVKIAGTDTKR